MATGKKVRFNVIDFLLIVLILLTVFAMFLRPMVLEKISEFTANDTIVVTFYADRLTEDEYAMLTEGDKFQLGAYEFGELLVFTTEPYRTLQLVESDVESEEPFYESVIEPGRYTVKGQIRVTGTKREDGFYVGGSLPVCVGNVYTVQSDSCVLTLQITGIS